MLVGQNGRFYRRQLCWVWQKCCHLHEIPATRTPKNSLFGNMHNGYIVSLTNTAYIAKLILH